MTILLIIGYIVALLAIFYVMAKICDEYFVDSLERIAEKFKLPEDVVGATFMAVGSSAPEFFTSLIAILSASEEIGSGTIVGSAIFNILVIVGGSSLVATAFLRPRPVIRDIFFYICSIVLLLITFRDGTITLFEASMYVLTYAVYIVVLYFWEKFDPSIGQGADELKAIVEETEKEEHEVEKRGGSLGFLVGGFDYVVALTFPNLKKNPHLYMVTFSISILYIIALSWLLVESAVGLSHLLGIPTVIISLTVLAGGTSIPDLLSSLIVAKKGRGDMAVSNAVGSNIFDILICLGLPWIIYILWNKTSITVETETLLSSILLLFFTVIAILGLFVAQKFKINKITGFVLIGLYTSYLVYVCVDALV